MRLFLAPLYHRPRFCRNCVRVLYQKEPGTWVWQHELQPMPPLGQFQATRGFIPDYSVLLMFDEYVMDAEASERISSEAAWLGEWPELVRILADEGALSVIDVQLEAARVSAIRGGMLRRDMRRPERWAGAMAHHDSLVAQVDRAFGFDGTAKQSFNWKADLKNLPGYRSDDGEYHMLSGCPLMPPHKSNHVDDELRERALGELVSELREVNATLAVAAYHDLVPMPWAPYAKYMAQKSAPLRISETTDLAAARLFFEVAFPRYRPETLAQFARLRADKRIKDLREAIRKAAASGDVLDPAYPQRVLEQVLSLERRVGKIRKVTGWLSTAADLLPIPGIGVLSKVAEEASGAVVERRARKSLSWFYLISNGRGLG